MTYRVELSRARIEVIDELASQPRPKGLIKLGGGAGALRVRVGVFRINYEIDDDILRILVLVIGHRKGVYRRL